MRCERGSAHASGISDVTRGSTRDSSGSGADQVVSVDGDHLAIERLYQALKTESNTTILPLVDNLTDPSPGLEWRHAGRQTLDDRSRPDLILALALVQQLALSGNLPLRDLIVWFASFNADLVIEFVAPEDPMVEKAPEKPRDRGLRGTPKSTSRRVFQITSRSRRPNGCSQACGQSTSRARKVRVDEQQSTLRKGTNETSVAMTTLRQFCSQRSYAALDRPPHATERLLSRSVLDAA